MHLALLEARDTLFLALADYSGLEKGAENGQSSYWSNRRRIIERAHQATYSAIGVD